MSSSKQVAEIELIDSLLEAENEESKSESLQDLNEAGRKSVRLYLEEREKIRAIQMDASENFLLVLRRWSSDKFEVSRMIKHFPSEEVVGGGYIVCLNGHFVAVDPGYDFVKNAGNADFLVDKIDYVIVSHNHPDHSSGLQGLINVHRAMEDKDRKIFSNLQVYCNKYTENEFKPKANGTAIKFFTITSQGNRSYQLGTSGVNCECKKTDHSDFGPSQEDRDKSDTMGFLLSYKDGPKLGLLTDTRDISHLDGDYTGSNVLVINVGTLGKSENHLGVVPSQRIAAAVHPMLVIASEFDVDEFAYVPNSRIKTAEEIAGGCKLPCLPADIGLKIILDKNDPMVFGVCTVCGKLHKVDAKAVNVIENTKRGSLSYFTDKHS